MESSKLLCLNGILFCSNSCKLKTFPLSIASVLTLEVNGPEGMRPRTNQRRLMSKAGKTKDIIIPTEPPRI